MTRTILRLPAVKATSGLSRSAIYALMAQGRFPRPLSLSIRAVGWLESDIDEWLSSRERAGCERTTKERVVTTGVQLPQLWRSTGRPDGDAQVPDAWSASTPVSLDFPAVVRCEAASAGGLQCKDA